MKPEKEDRGEKLLPCLSFVPCPSHPLCAFSHLKITELVFYNGLQSSRVQILVVDFGIPSFEHGVASSEFRVLS